LAASPAEILLYSVSRELAQINRQLFAKKNHALSEPRRHAALRAVLRR
jgi:hypothetical protein